MEGFLPASATLYLSTEERAHLPSKHAWTMLDTAGQNPIGCLLCFYSQALMILKPEQLVTVLSWLYFYVYSIDRGCSVKWGQGRKREGKINFSLQTQHPTLPGLKSVKGGLGYYIKYTPTTQIQSVSVPVNHFPCECLSACGQLSSADSLSNQNMCQNVILSVQTKHFLRIEIKQVLLNPLETTQGLSVLLHLLYTVPLACLNF